MLEEMLSKGFGPIPKDDSLKFEYIYTNIMTNVVIFLGLIITISFVTTTEKPDWTLIFEWAMAAILTVSLILRLVWSSNDKTVYNFYGKYIPVFALFCVMAELFYRGGNDGFVGIWALFMPIVAIFILGIRWGITISVIMLVWILVCSFIPATQYHYNYSIPILTRYLCAYIVFAILTCVYEGIRVKHHKKLVMLLNQQRIRTDNLLKLGLLDEATEINNIKGFQYYADKVCRFAVNNLKDMALAIIVIDDYKKLVETYGEEVGNMALRMVAKLLDTCACRPLDMVGRINDAKFEVLLFDTNMKEAAWICNKLAADIEMHQIILPDGNKVTITVTMGITSQIANSDLSLGSLITTAENNYYDEKKKV